MKWNDENYVRVYELAKTGLRNEQIAKAMGINTATLRDWLSKRPALDFSLARARAKPSSKGKPVGAITFREFIFNRLPSKLQKLWAELVKCETEKNGIARVEALLANQGEDTRQHLFLYALTSRNFNVAEACRAVYITRQKFDRWCRDDPDFLALIDEIHTAKKDFFEDHLVQLVANGDPSATIFANRTLNRDRGYADKQLVEVSGQVNHLHAHFSIDDLDLDLETRKKILAAVREKRSLTLEENE